MRIDKHAICSVRGDQNARHLPVPSLEERFEREIMIEHPRQTSHRFEVRSVWLLVGIIFGVWNAHISLVILRNRRQEAAHEPETLRDVLRGFVRHDVLSAQVREMHDLFGRDPIPLTEQHALRPSHEDIAEWTVFRNLADDEYAPELRIRRKISPPPKQRNDLDHFAPVILKKPHIMRLVTKKAKRVKRAHRSGMTFARKPEVWTYDEVYCLLLFLGKPERRIISRKTPDLLDRTEDLPPPVVGLDRQAPMKRLPSAFLLANVDGFGRCFGITGVGFHRRVYGREWQKPFMIRFGHFPLIEIRHVERVVPHPERIVFVSG